MEELKNLDLTKDQVLIAIRKNQKWIGYIEIKNGKLCTTGSIGENTYNNFVELLKGLQGFDICIGDLFF